MKKNLLKFGTLLVVSLLIACSGGNNPKNVAEHFLKATQAENFEGAKKYCTEGTGKLLDMMSSFSKMGDKDKDKKEKKEDKKFIMGEEKIEGDSVATVTYKMEGNDAAEQTVKLKKVNNKWLVDISKDDMSKKDGGAPKEGRNGEDNTPPAPDGSTNPTDTSTKK
jgi:hypothetical protein